jgi:hypothetical protein
MISLLTKRLSTYFLAVVICAWLASAVQSREPLPDSSTSTGNTPSSWNSALAGSVLIESASAIGLSAGVTQTGSGVKVGVICPGVRGWETSKASGDLPASFSINNVSGFNASISASVEGTAMMEIIHDIAPDAELYCAVPNNYQDYIDATNWLVSQGVKVIVSDIDYDAFDVEHPNGVLPYRGRSALSQHVTNLIQTNDISFIASSGNYATSHFRGTFNPDANGFHRFNYADNFRTFSVGGLENFAVYLSWEEPAGGSQTDLELIVADNNTWNFTAANIPSTTQAWMGGAISGTVQNATTPGDPFEKVGIYRNSFTIPAVYRFAVWDREHGKRPTSNVEFEVFVVTRPVDNVIGTVPAESNLRIPVDAVGVVVVGAATGVPSANPGDYRNESYSSQGPTNDGRLKPDLVAPDAVSTAIGNATDSRFSPFKGTSAAAPHVAGVVALMLEAAPNLKPDVIADVLRDTARYVNAYQPTPNNIVGYGMVFIPDAIASAIAHANSVGQNSSDEQPNYHETTFIRHPRDISVENIRILSETPLPNDTTLVAITADVRNTDTGVFNSVSLHLADDIPIETQMIDGFLQFQHVGELAQAVASANEQLSYQVNNEDLPAFREHVLSGEWITASAFERLVYAAPVRYIDAETDEAFVDLDVDGEEDILIFNALTALHGQIQPGDILIADPDPNSYQPARASPTDPFFRYYLSDLVPFQVESITEEDGSILVRGEQLTLFEALKSGSFEQEAKDQYRNGDPLNPSLGDTSTLSEAVERAILCLSDKEANPDEPVNAALCGMKVIPIRFNEVEITDQLLLSGEVLFRSSGLKFGCSIRNFDLKEVSVRVDAGVDGTLLLETTGEEDNITLSPFKEDNEDTILTAALPVITFNVGGVPIVVELQLDVTVGAAARVPAGLTLPLQSSVTVGMEMGWNRDDGFSSEPIREIVPLRISDPTVLDALEANARIWARSDVSLRVNNSVGPTLGVEMAGEFNLDPLGDPWWSLNAGLDLTGSFTISLFGLDLYNPETSFYHEDIISLSAEGSLLDEFDLSGSAAVSPMSSALRQAVDDDPVSGRHLRWAAALRDYSNQSGYSGGFVLPLQDGSYFIGGNNPISSFFARFTADGELVWMNRNGIGVRPIRAVLEEDGMVTVAGKQGSNLWIARYDSDGNRLWVQSYSHQSFTLEDFVRVVNPMGDSEYFLAGHIHHGLITNSDPAIIKLDANGQILWSKYLASEGDDEVHCIIATQDGNLLMAGTTDTPFTPLTWIDIGNNGLLLKMDPEGNILWTTAIASSLIMTINAISEDDQGVLYACGTTLGIITDRIPNMWLGKFHPNGALVDHVMIAEDPDWEQAVPGNMGDTAYDVAWDIEKTPGGFVIVGDTGLGQDKAAWAASITNELAVSWFSFLDGPRGEQLWDIEVQDDSFIALGTSGSILTAGQTNVSAITLLRYPLEGMIRFHPAFAIDSAYVQPRVYASSTDRRFVAAEGMTKSVPFVPYPLILPSGGEIPPDTTGIDTEVVRFENRNPGVTEVSDYWLY